MALTKTAALQMGDSLLLERAGRAARYFSPAHLIGWAVPCCDADWSRQGLRARVKSGNEHYGTIPSQLLTQLAVNVFVYSDIDYAIACVIAHS